MLSNNPLQMYIMNLYTLKDGCLMLNVKEKALFSGFLIAILMSFTGFTGKCEKISDKVLRLHVIANSDSYEDQQLKLKVRDRVLKSCEESFSLSKDLNQAILVAKNNISVMAKAAEDEIKKNGYDYKVDVQIVKMHFNTRHYNEVTLPAGKYNAVRITIGEAKGKNWWCVMFPPMCLPAAQEQKELEDVLNHDEMDVVKGGEKYEIKFKAVEIFDGIREWFESIFKILGLT